MFFDPNLTLYFRDLMPWAGPLFLIITELGGELFYLGLVLTGYWAYRKRDSITMAFVLVSSFFLNYWLKFAIQNPRPPESYWYEGYEASNFSTPSGHSQNSGTLFGWLAVKVHTYWMVVVSAVLIVLIGLSRVFLGVHYLGDVLLGWGIGLLTAGLFVFFEGPARNFFSRYREGLPYVLLFVSALVLLVISVFLPQPPDDNFGSLAGLLMGIAIALPLEKRFVGFGTEAVDGQKWRLALRVIIGLVLVLGLMIGLSPFLPTEDVLLRTVRYFLVVLVGVFVWPYVFKRVGL